METIDIYNYSVPYPINEGVKAHLVYVTPFVSDIVEYAGRTCYKSFANIKENSAKGFIRGIVNSGHESVIEHSNLIYVVFKPMAKKQADSDKVNRYMINLMMYNGLLKVSENHLCYIISGNIRMFKDLIRTYYDIKEKNGKTNPILDDITKSFYTLPDYFFTDFTTARPETLESPARKAILDPAKFNLNPKLKTETSHYEVKRLNDYVSVLNHDKFYYRIKTRTKDDQGNVDIRRLNIPTNVLAKHNRLTVIINAPRYITHQIVRHRLASYSQCSMRYVQENGVHVYTPDTFKANHMEALANSVFTTAYTAYNTMTNAGIPREDARGVLPIATMSTIVMTATIEEFKHFIAMRTDPRAQNFIREAVAIPLQQYLETYYEDKSVKGQLHSQLVQDAMESVINEDANSAKPSTKYKGKHFDPNKDHHKHLLKRRVQRKGNKHNMKKHR